MTEQTSFMLKVKVISTKNGFVLAGRAKPLVAFVSKSMKQLQLGQSDPKWGSVSAHLSSITQELRAMA